MDLNFRQIILATEPGRGQEWQKGDHYYSQPGKGQWWLPQGDQGGDSEECPWPLNMATLSWDALFIPPGPSHHPLGILIPTPLPQMESPGRVASGSFSPLMLGSCCAFLQAGLLQEEGGSQEDFSQLLMNFEQWLQLENSKLVRIIAMRTATAKDLRTREMKLQVCPQGKAPCP